jgi:hypothetical protein
MTLLSYEKKVNVTYLLAVAAILVMPDAIFGLLLELAHLLLELTHLAFELVESVLDHLVEHIFHTETRETQFIVFYIMVTLALGGLYFLWGIIQRLFSVLKNTIIAGFLKQKSQFLMYWMESAGNKFKLIAGFNAVLTIFYLVSF